MNKSILIALPVFLAVNLYVLASNFSAFFIDTKALLLVLGGGIAFALCGRGGWLSDSRLSRGAEGAVLTGWLGAMYGGVMILASIDERAHEWIGGACAVMLLTVVYGYFIRALCRIVILTQESD